MYYKVTTKEETKLFDEETLKKVINTYMKSENKVKPITITKVSNEANSLLERRKLLLEKCGEAAVDAAEMYALGMISLSQLAEVVEGSVENILKEIRNIRTLIHYAETYLRLYDEIS